RLSGRLRADPGGETYRQEPHPAAARWHPVLADHLQDRDAVFAVEAVRADGDSILSDRSWVLRLYVRYPGAFHEHECSIVQRVGDHLPDWTDLGADHCADILALPGLMDTVYVFVIGTRAQ